MSKNRILTGDRPSGRLHLGHYVGSLKNRVELQDSHESYYIIADYEYLTDNADKTELFEGNITELVLDYLAAGIDPKKSTIFIESQIPQISELNLIFSMITKASRVMRNPTIKEEIKNKDVEGPSFGYLGWPIIQAADIMCVKATHVPVGEDQVPHVEQTREIARFFNSNYKETFPVPEAIVPKGMNARLPGTDGKKMSKSLGNAIYLSDEPDIIEKKIMTAVTDPNRIKPTDPGNPDACKIIYPYYKTFAKDIVSKRCEECTQGKIGCVACKKEIAKKIADYLEPIREKRKTIDRAVVKEILSGGNEKVRKIAQETLDDVKEAMKIDYKKIL